MKNLSLYEKIDRVCRLGKHAIIKCEDGDYMIISPFKNLYGNWRESIICESVESASQYIADDEGYGKNDWNERERLGYKYIGVWTPPTYERFQVGDKVKINIPEVPSPLSEIISVGHFTYVIDHGYDTSIFCHEDLEPVFEEEEEIVEVLGKKYKKSELEKKLQELEEVEA